MNKPLDIYTWSVLLTIHDYQSGRAIERDLTVRARTEEDAIRAASRQWQASGAYAVLNAVAAPIIIAS
jgi:hypothetical protein